MTGPSLPEGYETMIRLANRGLYDEDLRTARKRRLVTRMVTEGWLVRELGPWTGKSLYRPTRKAVGRVQP
jgi:hypothetical protein